MDISAIVIVVPIIAILIIVVLFYRQPGRLKPTELHYFLPGEVIFKIRHSPTATPQGTADTKAAIVAAVQGFLGAGGNSPQWASVNVTQPAGGSWKDRLEMPQGATSNVITLQFTRGGPAFSFVRVPLKGYDPKRDIDTQAVRSILKDAYADLQQGTLPTLAGGFIIEDFSLNWLISNLHHGGATGGPGGPPTQAPPPTGGPMDFRLAGPTAGLTTITSNMPKKPTYVAILDTAPTGDAVADAYHNKWPNHAVLERLFGKGGKLTIHYANSATIYDMEHFSPLLHTYLMPDHGTFIAGIINSGAPDADLHLYQVLSRYGVGTFTSIAQGISDAILDLGRPLIINCSFQFCLPDGDYRAKLEADLGVPMAALQQSMQDLFEKEIAQHPNIVVVASAGNDSNNSATPPDRVNARFPAAFNNVVSVGALPKGFPQNTDGTYKPATYSNFAGDPHGSGFMTLGGESGSGQGIRGLYISSFPSLLNSNQTGWAWWAGTSFAAAIISGWLAGELSKNHGILPPVTPPPAGPYRTPDGETVILVEQL